MAMRKYSGPIFKKLFKKSFNSESEINSITRVRMNEALKDPTKVPKKSKVEKDYKEVENDALGLFKFVVDIAAATIICKRVIVPLIATPLAKKVEKKLDNSKATGSVNENSEAVKQPENEKQNVKLEEPKETDLNFENNPDTNLLSKYKK
jgi:hypothetical protein